MTNDNEKPAENGTPGDTREIEALSRTASGEDESSLAEIGRLRIPEAVPQEPLVSTRTLTTILGVFAIPVTAGVLLLFYEPILVAVITAALYVSLWFLFNPFPGFLLYMILVTVRPQEGIPQLEAMHVERLCAVLALLGWSLQAGVSRRILPLSRPIASWFFAFVVVCFLSIFTSVWKLAAVNAWIELLKLGVLLLLTSQLVSSPRRLFILLLVFAISNAWMATESLRLYFSEGYDYVRMGIVRATTDSMSRGDPNMLAASLLLAACMGLYVVRAHKKLIWMLPWLGVVVAGSVVVVLTGSRAAMLAVLFLLLYIWATSRKKFAMTLVVIAVVVAGWYSMPSQYQERFLTTFDFEMNPSA
ncbi:MAG: hypothetical protein V2A71_07345, partial [Candidatus Eisenbacteria bacterium]